MAASAHTLIADLESLLLNETCIYPETIVTTKGGDTIKVIARCHFSKDRSSEHIYAFDVGLYPENTLDCLGALDFKIHMLPQQHDTSFMQYKGLNFKLAEIAYIRNHKLTDPKGYKNIGAVLQECAFRLAIMGGAEGRIFLNAVRETHFFHYKYGFRYKMGRSYEYYTRLASAIFKAEGRPLAGDFGSYNLYLPRQQIEANLAKYHIKYDLPQFESESEEECQLINMYECLIEDTVQRGTGAQIILSLLGSYGPPLKKLTDGLTFFVCEDSYDETPEEKYQRANPSLLCSETRCLINFIVRQCLKKIPLHTQPALDELALFLAGAAIALMTIQDKNFGPQPLYGDVLLYPALSWHAIKEVGPIHFETLKALGTKALIEKTIPFDCERCSQFLPNLFAIQDLKQTYERVLLAEREDQPGVAIERLTVQ